MSDLLLLRRYCCDEMLETHQGFGLTFQFARCAIWVIHDAAVSGPTMHRFYAPGVLSTVMMHPIFRTTPEKMLNLLLSNSGYCSLEIEVP